MSAYLDNAHITRPSDEVMSKVFNFYSEKWGAPSQPHQMGQMLFPHLIEAWRSIYRLLGVSEQDKVLITSSAAEGIAQVFLSIYQEVTLNEGKNHFMTSAIDEAPAIMNVQRLESFGCASTLIKPNSYGIITPQAIAEAMTPRTALLALSWGNGLTGVIQPIAEIAQVCKLRKVHLLVDASHVIGKIHLNLEEFKPDFITFDGVQLHAPQGTAGLYIRQDVKLKSLILGGLEQSGLRAGVLNTAGLIALSIAAKQAYEAIDYLNTEVARLKYYFENEILKRIPIAKIVFREQERLPHITCVAFPGLVNEALLFLLNQQKIYASIGGGEQQQIGFALTACGVDLLMAHGALSFALSRETTEAEIDMTLDSLEALVSKLQKMSANLREI